MQKAKGWHRAGDAVQNMRYVVVTLVAFAVTSSAFAQAQPPSRSRLPNHASLSEANSLSQAFRQATDSVLPAVVKIRTTANKHRRVLINGIFPMELPEQVGLGSGVIIDPSGIVMTNNHVVKDADEIIVVTQDGAELYATEYTTDPLTDLAIVRVKSNESLPAARFGDSDAMSVGDWVLAIGHPLELETSVSAGIISAKGRSLEKAKRAQFLQTDAAINPGNSGGPLVNLRGEVIGINTAIASQTGGYQGIGFAVPANLAKDVVNQLREEGAVARGYLGVTVQKLTRELARQLGIRNFSEGAVVNEVKSGTPAADAGIRPGDVITQFAKLPVSSPSSLQRAVERVPIGSKQRLVFTRFGKPMAVNVFTLQFTPEQYDPEDLNVTKKLSIPVRNNSTLGFEVADLADLARRQGIRIDRDAVVITRVQSDSLAADEGLTPGMIIKQVRDVTVSNVRELNDALRKESLSEGILLLVRDTTRDSAAGDRFVVVRAYQ